MAASNRMITELEQIKDQVITLIENLREDQWEWEPSARSWSIARCIDHINTVNGLVIPRVEAAIEQGIKNELRAPGPFRYPLFDRLFVFALEPRAPVKQQSPGIYRPSPQPERGATREQFIALHDRLIRCTQQSQGLDLVRIKISSPVSDRLRFSLGTWLAASLAHEQNHYEQAARVQQQPGFPRG